MAVHLAVADGRSPDATETQDAARSRRKRAPAARLVSGPATCGPALARRVALRRPDTPVRSRGGPHKAGVIG